MGLSRTAVLASLLVVSNPGTSSSAATVLVSLSSVERQGDGPSSSPAISADGRFVAFESGATNLVPGDTNAAPPELGYTTFDVFVRDLRRGTTERVSVASDGTQANGDSFRPALSADGRFVAFVSCASNLVAEDTNGGVPPDGPCVNDVFVHDRATGGTTRVSVDSDGRQADGESLDPAISADGRLVAFTSFATNLVADDTNERGDVFVHDLVTGATRRVSVSSLDEEGNDQSGEFSYHQIAISGDGRSVVFRSRASNLVPGDDEQCPDFTSGRPTFVNCPDVFVHDLVIGETSRISSGAGLSERSPGGGSPAVSYDGRFVAFIAALGSPPSPAIFVHDRTTGEDELVSVDSAGLRPAGFVDEPAISSDGRFVAFVSSAPGFVSGDTNDAADVFVRDRLRALTIRASIGLNGEQANGGDLNPAFASRSPALSADGRFVGFSSDATNLVRNDRQICLPDPLDPSFRVNCHDVFVRDLEAERHCRPSRLARRAAASAPSSLRDSCHPSLRRLLPKPSD